MATSVVPKSLARKTDSIIVGFAEVPAVWIEGRAGWGLPGGHVTYSREAATVFAEKLNIELQRTVKNPSQLISAKPSPN